MQGKQAFSFYNRKTGESVRLVLKPVQNKMTREESFIHYQSLSPYDMFEVKETTIKLPEEARILIHINVSAVVKLQELIGFA